MSKDGLIEAVWACRQGDPDRSIIALDGVSDAGAWAKLQLAISLEQAGRREQARREVRGAVAKDGHMTRTVFKDST